MTDTTDYADPAFVARVHAWAREATSRLGLPITGAIEQFHLRPWSTVFRFATVRGRVYLKCCGPTQRHEPCLSALLHRVHPGIVPDVLALHPAEPWMLVSDGGDRVADVYTGDALLRAWRDVLPRYAELERALMPHVAAALACGTPDHRAAALTAGLARTIADETVLFGERADRLTPDEHAALARVLPRVEAACRELAASGIPDTVQHDDLHHGNLLVRDGRAVVFDWGDACVSHPFLTLAVTLRFAAARTERSEDAPEILALRDAYLESWSDLAAREDLRAAADLGRRLGQVSRTLTWHAVARAYPGVVDHYPGGFAGSLRRVLSLFA